ncbi:Ras GTPase-activating-like protein IQGAP1 [Frankliniella fusca]|uniref:Ras GTPase-activating-like protein IQGAP1 n=1 Tax=Frankliniella fusca TaxID=407009 RepID=A0AAE1H5E3_9NEOP|nr:Ras GTPase-activating-like protein IQGAP1 [Frankliniella fusca]
MIECKKLGSFFGGTTEEVRHSAQEMDETRKRNLAYEYLCHLEEAKVWMEAVLGEKLPSAAQLEESLRNGVYLARLAHIVTPEDVPLNRIYDREQKRYRMAGLQFRHTDNINYWIRSLKSTNLPRTFHPETTDVYDKKNMPRVIYCIHALSTHLFKLGLTPAIQDLYGKVQFSDQDLETVQKDLEDAGAPMPAFQRIGGLLSGSRDVGGQPLRKAIEAVDKAIALQDVSMLMEKLSNPSLALEFVSSDLANDYLETMINARSTKRQGALNRSLNDSCEAEDFDELLDQAELQGHINTVNLRSALRQVLRAADRNASDKIGCLLQAPSLQLKNVNIQNGTEYVKELKVLCGLREAADGRDCIVIRQRLQQAIDQANKAANTVKNTTRALEKMNRSLESGCLKSFCNAMHDPALQIDSSLLDPHAMPLYFSELSIDKAESGNSLSYPELIGSLKVLNTVAQVTRSVHSGSVELTWKALSNPSLHLSGLEPGLKIQYMNALRAALVDAPVLGYSDIQAVVDSVRAESEQRLKVISSLQAINDAVQSNRPQEVLKALQQTSFKLSESIGENDAPLLLLLLRTSLYEKEKQGGGELWLCDVENAVHEVVAEVHEAQTACFALARLNVCLNAGVADLRECMDCLVSAGLIEYDTQNAKAWHDALQELQKSKHRHKHHSAWIDHLTSHGHTVYLNMESYSYSWDRPSDFHPHSHYLSHKDVRNALGAGERLVALQARCRGFLVRKGLADRKEFWRKHTGEIIQIQSWWRGIVQQKHYQAQLLKLKEEREKQARRRGQGILEYYRKHVDAVVRIQALWRGRQARKAFSLLVHRTNPPFKVVRMFVPLLDFSTDDYERELELQSLQGAVVQRIRHNQELSRQIDAMDIKIGLLVQNRVTLQDVVAHGKTLNSVAKGKDREKNSPRMSSKAHCTLKTLTREGRRLLDGYKHLFYTLQTNPSYLAKLLFRLPQSRSVKFLQNVILSLFNFGASQREEYLMLKLFRTALIEEIKCKCEKLSDAVTSNPMVLKMVVNYARQHSGQNALRTMVGPLIERVLNDKNLSIETNPVDIYKSWRNQIEMETGKSSDLPHNVTQEEALSHNEVRRRLHNGLQMLQAATLVFLQRICDSKNLIPYGLLYMAKTLRQALLERFPGTLEKDILKIVGHLVYYQLINSAIVAPDAFDIVTLPADRNLSNEQRRNLASIAKILQFAASKKGFGEESPHLVCLNPFIVECHEKFKDFFRRCCEVEELEDHFSINRYSEATLIQDPCIYITLQEIVDTHSLLLQYEDQISSDPMDPLHELLEDLGGVPTTTQLLCSDSAHAAPQLLQAEICLSLADKFQVPEEDTTDLNKLFVKTKELLVLLLPLLQGDDLLKALSVPDTPAQQLLYEERLRRRDRDQKQLVALNRTFNTDSCWSLRDCKQLLRRYLSRLELAGLASSSDAYQSVVTAIAQDLCHKGLYRQQRARELVSLRNTIASLDSKTRALQEQVDFYNEYIKRCLDNLNAGKRSVHSLKVDGKVPGKLKSKLTLKYTAAKLQEKGVLLEVEGLPPTQLRNVTFEISPSEMSGVFTVRGKFMGVEMEKVDVDIQHLLELQFEGCSIMDMFGKAKVNVNLLLFLLNRKFYGKT